MEEQFKYQAKKDKWIDTIGSALLKIFVLMMLFCWVVAYYPPYEKMWYNKTEPVTPETCEEAEKEYEDSEFSYAEYHPRRFSGYPTEGMTTEIKNYEQFFEMIDEEICLEVDASKLKPTGVYAKVYDFSSKYVVSGSSYSKYNRARGGTVTSSFHTAPDITTGAGAFLNRYRAIYAQYYVLSFEERDRVLILINDTVVDIPKKGKVQLPFAAGSIMRIDLEGPEISKLIVANNLNYDGDYMYYLDAATYWFMFGLDDVAFEEFRDGIAVILLVTGGIGNFILIVYVLVTAKREETPSQGE